MMNDELMSVVAVGDIAVGKPASFHMSTGLSATGTVVSFVRLRNEICGVVVRSGENDGTAKIYIPASSIYAVEWNIKKREDDDGVLRSTEHADTGKSADNPV